MDTKRKLVPVELWNIGEIESWLIEQAQNGRILEKLSSFRATFLLAEPQNLEYRMIVMPEKDTTRTNAQELEQAGWYYVTSHQYYHIFCSQQADATTEIEKDLMQQAQSFSGILLDLRKRLLFNVLMIVAFIGLVIALFMDVEAPITSVIGGSSISVLVFFYTNGSLTVTIYKDYLKVMRIKNQLEQGIVLDHHASWRSAKVKKFGWSWLNFVFAAILIWMLVISFTKSGNEILPKNTADLPLLRLHMIELPKEMELSVRDHAGVNSLEQNWSIFAPVQYEVNENVDIPTENQVTYSPWLHFRVIECTVPSLANALFYEWVTYYRFENDAELSHAAFDQVIVEQIFEDKVRILTKKDNQVQYVDYQGEANVEAILSALENL
ncbi:DUF2812 domain-containing protein [Solibacillus daqui]|uniref:DUF2812 domain-containing protein n=1 Tax=Solibacillus daqui TaxID=2912187 RepID=UPI002366A7D2|nr:DUF2812 domain-containing protein [Solibacillus daqui]